MNIGEMSIISTFIWILFIYFVFGFENSLKSIITSEFLWVSLFCSYLIYSCIFDNNIILSMTLFFLIFSAIEISICMVIIVFQKKVLKTFNFNLFINNKFSKLKSKNTGFVKFKL